mgnify:CR=1 FL=1
MFKMCQITVVADITVASARRVRIDSICPTQRNGVGSCVVISFLVKMPHKSYTSMIYFLFQKPCTLLFQVLDSNELSIDASLLIIKVSSVFLLKQQYDIMFALEPQSLKIYYRVCV